MLKNKNKTAKGILLPIDPDGETLSHISHELKSFITSAKAYAQLATRSAQKGESFEKQIQFTQKIDTQLMLLTSYLNDFFGILRFQAKKEELSMESVSLKDLITNAIGAVNKYYPDNKISLGSLPDINVIVDKNKFEKLLFHIFLNGIKFSQEGADVNVTVLEEKKHIIIYVANIGKPIAQKDLKKVFEPFFQGNKNGNQNGLGIGLYLAKEIIKLHKGSISIESKENKTVVEVSFPIF